MRLRMTVEDLREIVRDEISNSIEMHRASRVDSNSSYEPPSGEPTDSEVDDFIGSNQLVDIELIENLLDPGLLGYAAKTTSVRAEWLQNFRKNIKEWAETNTWLGADLEFVEQVVSPEVTSSDLWYPRKEEGRPPWLYQAPGALFIAADLLKKGRLLSELDWKEFEKLIAKLLDEEGWNVELTRGSKDGGIDIIASLNDPSIGKVKSIWQAKKYAPSNKVGLSKVRELSAVRDDSQATKGIMVTTSSLTKGALDWIRKDEYRLDYKEKEDVENWVKKLM